MKITREGIGRLKGLQARNECPQDIREELTTILNHDVSRGPVVSWAEGVKQGGVGKVALIFVLPVMLLLAIPLGFWLGRGTNFLSSWFEHPTVVQTEVESFLPSK